MGVRRAVWVVVWGVRLRGAALPALSGCHARPAPPATPTRPPPQALCNAPLMDGLIRFFGAYHSADRGQIAVVLEYMDGGSLADVVTKVRWADGQVWRRRLWQRVGKHGVGVGGWGVAGL